MKVKKVMGSIRKYEFEDGELVDFSDIGRYKQKMKEGSVETVIKAPIVDTDIRPIKFRKRGIK